VHTARGSRGRGDPRYMPEYCGRNTWMDAGRVARIIFKHALQKWRGTRWPEGRGFDFHWHNPSGRTLASEMDSSSYSIEYQEHCMDGKGGRCVGLTPLSPSCAKCLWIWELQPSWALWACNRPEQGLLYPCLQQREQPCRCYFYKAICDWTYVTRLSPRGIGLKPVWLLARFVVHKVVLEQVYLRSSSIFPSHSLFRRYVIVSALSAELCDSPDEQNIIVSLIVKLGA